MIRQHIFTIWLALISGSIYAQCGFDVIHQQLEQANPMYLQQQDAFESFVLNATPSSEMILTVPVVVHVIHNNGPENIPLFQAQNAIDHLNGAFRNRHPYDSLVGADTEIEFCLAIRDPNGLATTGVNYVQNTLTTFDMDVDDLNLKNLIRWDPNDYLNIWVVREINSTSMGPGVAGYATLPGAHGFPSDGIVVEALYFGNNFHNSKVTVHEAGHYLGLYHTFQGGCINNDCQLDGDRVCDTPPDGSTATVPCPASFNSCSTDEDDASVNNPFRAIALGGLGDQNDLHNNYMDYGDFVCYDMFTTGQSDRMRAAINGPRVSLLSSQGCVSPCTDPIIADFDLSADTVVINTVVNFTNQSSGNVLQYEWYVDGNFISNNLNESFNFTNPGVYTVTLTISNNDANCTQTINQTVWVTCNTLAIYDINETTFAIGDTLSTTNNSINATGYVWLLDGQPIGSTTDLDYWLEHPGGYTLQLVALGNDCNDTTRGKFISVGNCINVNRGNHWYFGDGAGLDFATSPPTVLLNGGFNNFEGNAAISDANGNLQMYTNGVHMYDPTHMIMDNGDSMVLYENAFAFAGWSGSSSTQSSILVPWPDHDSLVLGFFVEAMEEYPNNRFLYSVIDVSANGGNGRVLTKQNPLLTNPCEKVAAVPHCNGRDYWVVTKEYNSVDWYAWLITPNGIQFPPVISSVGSHVFGGGGSTPNDAGRGAIKFSPDGQKFAAAHRFPLNTVEIFDFDNSTGQFSNPIVITNQWMPYHIEFSYSGEFLYISYANQLLINQINVSSNNQATIQASMVAVTDPNIAQHARGMQLAKDGLIYVAMNFSEYVGAIVSPNLAGMACDFQDSLIQISPRTNDYNLPTFPVDFYSAELWGHLIGPDVLCVGETGTYYTDRPACIADTSFWESNGNIEWLYTSNDTAIILLIGEGDFTLRYNSLALCGLNTISKDIATGAVANDLVPDTSVCDDVNTLDLSPGTQFTSINWFDNTSANPKNFNNSGQFWVTVTDSSGCSATDSFEVIFNTLADDLELGSDTNYCVNDTNTWILIGIDNQFLGTYNWSTGATTSSILINQSGTYWVEAIFEGCAFSDTVNIDIGTLSDTLDLGPDITKCEGDQITLSASGYENYSWSSGSTDSFITTSNPDTYWLHAYKDGCDYYDTVIISDESLTQSIIDEENITICPGETATLTANPGFDSYAWNSDPSSNTMNFNTSSTGLITIDVVENGCTYSDSVWVSSTFGSLLNISDTTICTNQEFTIRANPQFTDILWNTGETNHELTVDQAGNYVVQGELNGCNFTSSVVVEQEPCDCQLFIPTAFSPNDDGVNDQFNVLVNCPLAYYTIQIFNRWGELVYEREDNERSWKGTLNETDQPLSVFSYIIQYRFEDQQRTSLKSGNVTLLR